MPSDYAGRKRGVRDVISPPCTRDMATRLAEKHSVNASTAAASSLRPTVRAVRVDSKGREEKSGSGSLNGTNDAAFSGCTQVPP